MRLLGIDLETTGLDHAKDSVTEMAWVIKDVGDPKPLSVRTYFIKPPDAVGPEYISDAIAALTRIKMSHLTEHGRTLTTVMGRLAHDLEHFQVDTIVAHNGENFDRPFLRGKTTDCNPKDLASVFDRTWLDSSLDIIYPSDCRYTNLMFLAAYHEFLNPFPHSALFDVMTMLRICELYDMEKALARAREPWVTVQAVTSYPQRHLAKERRYNWENLGAQHYPKAWVKRIKANEVEKEKAEAPFPVVVM